MASITRIALTTAPNPFRGSTTLAYALPAAGRVRMSVFDARGRRLIDLLDGHRPAGPGSVRWDAHGVPAGVYFARLEAGGEILARTLVFVD